MTKLDKPITREGRTVIDGRPIILTLKPGDVIEVRLKGTVRQKVELDATSIWWIAHRAAAKKAAEEKRKLKRLKRLGAA